MKKYLFAVLLLCATLESAKASFFDRFYVGGGVGMEFGSGNTNFDIQPLLGYHVTQPWSVGVQLYYSYSNNNNFKQNGYGGGVFTRYDVNMPAVVNRIFPAIHFHAEYDYIRYNTRNKFYDTNTTSNYNMLPMGMGVYIGAGGRSRVSFTALWDVLHLSGTNGAPSLRIGILF